MASSNSNTKERRLIRKKSTRCRSTSSESSRGRQCTLADPPLPCELHIPAFTKDAQDTVPTARSWSLVRPSPTTAAVCYSSTPLRRRLRRRRCRIRSPGLKKRRELLLLLWDGFSMVGRVRTQWLGARDGEARELRVAPASWPSRAAICRTGVQHVGSTADIGERKLVWS
jgi:hypothetical protein